MDLKTPGGGAATRPALVVKAGTKELRYPSG